MKDLYPVASNEFLRHTYGVDNAALILFDAALFLTLRKDHMKKLLLGLLLTISPVILADWLDDMVVAITEKNEFDVQGAAVIIQKYIDQDRKEIESLEKQEQENNKNGFWSHVRGGTYKVQLLSARSSLKSHERVAGFLKELPENKKSREDFVRDCKSLQELNQELVQLQKEYEQEKRYAGKVSLGAQIAAKSMHIQTKKTLMKTFSVH